MSFNNAMEVQLHQEAFPSLTVRTPSPKELRKELREAVIVASGNQQSTHQVVPLGVRIDFFTGQDGGFHATVRMALVDGSCRGKGETVNFNSMDWGSSEFNRTLDLLVSVVQRYVTGR